MRGRFRLGLLAAAVLVGGCGGSGSTSGGGGGKPELVVSAASSLKSALTVYAQGFPNASVRLSFAGSDALAAQIEQGVKPDLFASANTKLPAELYAEGLVERPEVFAANRLVIAVPSGSSKVASLADLAQPGTTAAIGSPSVPVGAYSRAVLARLPRARAASVLANVRSNEPDVGGVIGKVTQGAVDAGFVYITDVKATAGRARAIEIPPRLQPRVTYGVAIVKGARHRMQAQAFIAGLVSGAGQAALRRAGFEPPSK